MKTIRSTVTAFAAALSFAGALALTAAPAQAQATRTWVSGVGDDVNPCSRTAPCKTFAGAISKTAAGGEINCLDPGGYGTVTITKSLTIDCTGTFGSTLNSGGINGIVVNDSLSASPNTSDVILRGLSINGAGTTPGLNGIRFISGRSLFLQDIFIQNQNSGAGISFQPGSAAELHANNVSITDGNNGIVIQPTGAGGSAKVTLSNVRVHNNSASGLRIDSTGNTSGNGIAVEARLSEFNGNTAGGIAVANPAGTNSITLMVVDSVVANNLAGGVITNGPAIQTRIGNTTITGNTLGILAAGGSSITSFATNQNFGNPIVGAANNGTFTATVPQN
jgi:hypothetical protein